LSASPDAVLVLVCRSTKKEYSDESLIYRSPTGNCLSTPPKNKTKPTNPDANPHSRFFRLCRNTTSLDVALFSGAKGKKRRDCDCFRRRKRARHKPSCVADRRNATKIKGVLAEFLALGVKVSGRGKEDQGSGKGGPKRLRQGLRGNTRRSMKPANWRWVARRRLGEPTQTGPWPSASSPGRRLETGAERIGEAPTARASQGSPPDDFSGHQRHPNVPPTVVTQGTAILA